LTGSNDIVFGAGFGGISSTVSFLGIIKLKLCISNLEATMSAIIAPPLGIPKMWALILSCLLRISDRAPARTFAALILSLNFD
jgi:hypothetical protein